ncbi:MAG: type II toxin-antitoxin system HicB family antitoxin [Alphaproteobacteria bacterium]|nr:type II toxin-antitoxin system HicB family antitoxin [Alphaproteobacteria bacterium]
MTDLAYPFTVRPLSLDEGGGWLVEFPDLPGCMADGETPEAAIHEAADAVRSWIETARLRGDSLPPPSRDDLAAYSGKWVLRTPKSLHRKLSERAKMEGVSLNMLAVSLLAEGLGERTSDSRK